MEWFIPLTIGMECPHSLMLYSKREDGRGNENELTIIVIFMFLNWKEPIRQFLLICSRDG